MNDEKKVEPTLKDRIGELEETCEALQDDYEETHTMIESMYRTDRKMNIWIGVGLIVIMGLLVLGIMPDKTKRVEVMLDCGKTRVASGMKQAVSGGEDENLYQ